MNNSFFLLVAVTNFKEMRPIKKHYEGNGRINLTN